MNPLTYLAMPTRHVKICTRTLRTLLFVVAAFCLSVVAGPQTIVSNLDKPVGSGGEAGSDNWFAQGFSMPLDAGYSLTNVTLTLAKAPAQQGTFTVSLWSATALGQPQSQLMSFSSRDVATLTTSFTNYSFAPSSPLTLAAGGSYFVVLSASATLTNSGLVWADSTTFDPGYVGSGKVGGWTQSYDHGATWEAVEEGFPFKLAVLGKALPVGPRLESPHFGPAGFTCLVRTVRGQKYVLEYRNSLNEPWTPLTSVVGDGTVMTLGDTSAPGAERFYRVSLP